MQSIQAGNEIRACAEIKFPLHYEQLKGAENVASLALFAACRIGRSLQLDICKGRIAAVRRLAGKPCLAGSVHYAGWNSGKDYRRLVQKAPPG
ncbi:MAG TPA: hypothetical protein PK869_02280, partial [Candidatus Hydrogenedentes bacterium]|nr:hypothetical protein [Candidatus Hydrogenedentota bacterium]